jgi:soluble lytic murein transglycosylase-like protein
MSINVFGIAALAGVGAVLLSTPEGQRQARAVASKATGVLPKSPSSTPAQIVLPAGLEPYRAALKSAAARNGMRWTLLAGLVMVENAPFDPRATRREPHLLTAPWILETARRYKVTPEPLVTSWGLGQILGATALEVGFRQQFQKLLDEPALSLEMAARYWLARRKRWSNAASSGSGRDWLALIAYNGGDGAVKTVLAGGSHPSAGYAAKVLAAEQRILKGGAA